MKRESINLFFPRLHSIENCTLECFTDASLMNLPSGKSQGGLIIFLQDEAGQKCPIFWQSKKLERTVKSTIAAEAQALVDGSEMAVYLLRVITLIESYCSEWLLFFVITLVCSHCCELALFLVIILTCNHYIDRPLFLVITLVSSNCIELLLF